MNHLRIILVSVGLFFISVQTQADFVPPTEGQLDQLLANPELINTRLKGANGTEAAEVIIRVINRLIAANLNPTQTSYLVSLYTARTLFLLPPAEAETYARTLLNQAPQTLVPTIMTALSIGSAGIPNFTEFLEEVAGESEVLQNAINNPINQLTSPVYNLLLGTLGSSQSTPPVIIDSLPAPDAEGDLIAVPTTPPVADGYAGQTGG